MCKNISSVTHSNPHVKGKEEQLDLFPSIPQRSCGEKCKACKRLLCETPSIAPVKKEKMGYFVP